LSKLKPVHSGHGIVSYHDVERRIGFQKFQGVGARLSLGDAVTEVEQHVGRSHTYQNVVIHQQYAQASRFSWPGNFGPRVRRFEAFPGTWQPEGNLRSLAQLAADPHCATRLCRETMHHRETQFIQLGVSATRAAS
jgi:hypothetical protein